MVWDIGEGATVAEGELSLFGCVLRLPIKKPFKNRTSWNWSS
jgi:hypothetical protein